MVEMLGTREAYGEALVELGQSNEDIVVLDANLSSSTRTSKFAEKFPERFFNMEVSEQDMLATAAGLAASGKIPFASTFAIFAAGRAWEVIRQSICYPRQNVRIVATHGGITVGPDGASHQCTEDVVLMRVLPNMSVAEECPAPLRRVGVKDQFGTSGSPQELLIHYGLSAQDIVRAVEEVVQLKARVSLE